MELAEHCQYLFNMAPWGQSASANANRVFARCEQSCTNSSCEEVEIDATIKGYPMTLLFWYVGFVLAGDVLAYLIGRFVE